MNFDRGPELGASYQQLDEVQHQATPAFAYLVPMALFDQSAALMAFSQDSLQTQNLPLGHQLEDTSYLADKALGNQASDGQKSLEDKEEDESYGSVGKGVGALNLAEGAPASLSSGPAINSYGHSSSGSSGWVPIKNPHQQH